MLKQIRESFCLVWILLLHRFNILRIQTFRKFALFNIYRGLQLILFLLSFAPRFHTEIFFIYANTILQEVLVYQEKLSKTASSHWLVS